MEIQNIKPIAVTKSVKVKNKTTNNITKPINKTINTKDTFELRKSGLSTFAMLNYPKIKIN